MDPQVAEKVVGKVAVEVKEEILGDIEDGRAKAQDIMVSVERETLLEVKRGIDSTARQIEAMKRRVMGGAEVAARNASLQILEEMVERAFKGTLERLSGMRGTERYRVATKRFMVEGIRALGGEEVVVQGNGEDKKLLGDLCKEISKEMGVKLHLEEAPVKSAGGAVLRTPDGMITLDNTVEKRLERWKGLLRKEISTLLAREGGLGPAHQG